jgi:hypothetical protein
MSENAPPRNGLKISARPSASPARRPAIARRGAACAGTIDATSDSAQAAACCGVYHNERGNPSIVRPRSTQDVIASMFR